MREMPILGYVAIRREHITVAEEAIWPIDKRLAVGLQSPFAPCKPAMDEDVKASHRPSIDHPSNVRKGSKADIGLTGLDART